MAETVSAGVTGYLEAVSAGPYAPLGAGDLDVVGIVTAMEESDNRGWYVMGQDTVIDGPPDPDAEPIADVRGSIEFLTSMPEVTR